VAKKAVFTEGGAYVGLAPRDESPTHHEPHRRAAPTTATLDPTPDPTPTPLAEKSSYEALTVLDLRSLVHQRKLDVPSHAKKAELVAALEASDASD
jgi:hypothetical protein